MLATLIASRPSEAQGGSGAVVSVVVHGALITMAVLLTGRTVMPPRDAPDVSSVVYFPPAHASPKSSAPREVRHAVARSIDEAPPVIREHAPAPPMPGPIVPRTFEPAKEPGTPLPGAGATASPVPAGAAPGGSTDGTGAASGGDAAPFTDDQVERTVQAIRPVPPRYPELLRAAGITGTVRVRFVVDADGSVEPASIEILDATQAAFGDAVRRALLATRYRPAEASGRHVRQLVEQAFTFRLGS